MMRLLTAFLAVGLVTVSCTRPSPPQPREAGSPPAPQAIVSIYRGLRVTEGNQIDWTKNSFGVSGNPVATLSFFDTMNNADIPCWLEVPVTVPAVPVPVNGGGTIAIPAPPPGGANPGPWAATFDNNPAGHWSIAKATIGGGSNNQSSTMAAAVFQAMAGAGTATVRDGSVQGCH